MAIKLNIIPLNQILILYLLSYSICEDKNEISIIIDTNMGSQIINYRYNEFIFKVIVNGIESNITKYKNHLKSGENEIIILFIIKLSSCQNMFYHIYNILKMNLSHFDLSEVKNMGYMFADCNSLVSLDLSNFDTSSVTNMGYMFQSCFGLESLDISRFNTSLITTMLYMFQYCRKLKSLDLSNFDTSLVTTMEGTFYECLSLSSLNIKSFNTSSVKTMKYMFYNCFALTSIDFSNFDTSLVTNMKYMFECDKKIKYFELKYFNTSSVVDMGNMFYGCISLISLNFGKFDTSSVTNMQNMFYNCHSLITLKIEELNLLKLKKTDLMFYNCSSLQYLNLSNFYSNITSVTGMFGHCNRNLIYCIDDRKEYQFLSELKNYRKSCSDICYKYFSKKYLKENNSCIDSCANEVIYKYDFNNNCIEKCPDNTILGNDNLTCHSIEIENKENNFGIILFFIVFCPILLLLIFFLIAIKCRQKKKNNNNENEILIDHGANNIHTYTHREVQNIGDETIKIIFNFNQERTIIFKHRRTSFKNLIISYKERKQFKNIEMFIFILDGIHFNYNEAINDERKLSEFIPRDIKEKEIIVYDWTSFASVS